MKRNILTVLSIIVFLAAGCNNQSTSNSKKVYHIGIVSAVPVFTTVTDSFKEKMTELGYIEGKNIVYDVQDLNGDLTKDKPAINKFVTDKVDLVLAFPTEPALTAKTILQDKNIPLIFVGTSDGTSLIDSIQSPGGNLTGVRDGAPESTAKRLELLHEIAPLAKKIYFPYDKNYPNTQPTLALVRSVASLAGITLVEVPVSNPDELLADIKARDAAKSMGVDAILLMPNPLLVAVPPVWAAISDFADRHSLPIAGVNQGQAQAGAALSYFPQNQEMGNLAATLADKIFKGIPAGTIPVQTANSYLIINYKKTLELGLTVSEGTLSQANELIH